MKIAIIGAGISGLSAGNLLQEKGHQITVYEKKSYAGGLVACSEVNGTLYHQVGGHVFNSKIPEVLHWFWRYFHPSDFQEIKRVARIFFQDKIIGYPIENYLYQLENKDMEQIIHELLNIYLQRTQQAADFDEFLINHFGTRLYNLYFKPYNEKVWKTSLKDIPLKWLDGKLPMPDIPEIIISNIAKKEENQMVHSCFWYPKKGGSQFIADVLAKSLNIEYNMEISGIKRINHQWAIHSQRYDALIYTADVRDLQTVLSNDVLPEKEKLRLKALKSNATSNVLCEIDKNGFSWMYFPENKYKIHRIIYTGNFSAANNGNTNRNTCTIEYSGRLSESGFSEEIKRLPGNPKILAYNYEPNSYILHDVNTGQIITTLKKRLEKQSFYLVGRFAEWEYYNMDKAIEASMKLANHL